MTMRFTFTANAAAGIAAMALLILGSAVGHAGPAPGSAQYNLQQQQQRALNNLAQQFQQLKSAAGNDPELLDLLYYQYLSDAYRIKQYYLSQDTRGQMINDAIQKNALLDAAGNPVLDKDGKIVSDIENTGSAPKDVRSDVDLNAKTPEAAENAINDWQASGHDLVGPDQQPLTSIDWNNPPYKVVDTTTDTTLWLPCKTQACLDAKVRDPDAWTTEGGLQGTGNSGRVPDPYGYYLDNEKKFAHAEDALENLMNGGTSDMSFDDALKTVAKSLYKAAGMAGNDNSELLAQADALRNYADSVEAGIADPGDSPDVVAQKVQQWLQNAETEMLQLKGILQAAGEALTAARFAEADRLLNAAAEDPAAYQKALDAGKIVNDQSRVDASNAPAERVNIDLGGVGAQAPPQKPSLAKQLGATTTSPKCFANGAARAGLGAGVGILASKAISYVSCMTIWLTTGKDSPKKCASDLLSTEGVGQAAAWGAVAALGPWGEIAAAFYGGYQGASQIGTMFAEMLKTLTAVQQVELLKITSELFEPVDNAISSCDFGKALLIAQRLQQQKPRVGIHLGMGVQPNYTPLIARLTKQQFAEEEVKDFVEEANTATDPAQQEQFLNYALQAGEDGNIPNACMQQWIPPSCPAPPQQAANTGACANPNQTKQLVCWYDNGASAPIGANNRCPTVCTTNWIPGASPSTGKTLAIIYSGNCPQGSGVSDMDDVSEGCADSLGSSASAAPGGPSATASGSSGPALPTSGVNSGYAVVPPSQSSPSARPASPPVPQACSTTSASTTKSVSAPATNNATSSGGISLQHSLASPSAPATNNAASNSGGLSLQHSLASPSAAAMNNAASSGGGIPLQHSLAPNPCHPTSAATSTPSQPNSNKASAQPASNSAGAGQHTSSLTPSSRNVSGSQTTPRRSFSSSQSGAPARSASSFRPAQSGGFGGGGRHPSDIRLKEDIAPLGRLGNGIGLYRFRYKGDDHTVYVGVMAQEVQNVVPRAVSRDRDGFLLVDYDRLGIRFMTWDEWRSRPGATTPTVN